MVVIKCLRSYNLYTEVVSRYLINYKGDTMDKNYTGLDVLRGLGIFVVIWLHSAFYYFDGLYDLDFNNPPLIITLIGLLLMFAGVFAMVSGTVHTIQSLEKLESGKYEFNEVVRYNIVSGFLILAVAYLYFIFTGPGLVDIARRSMNNSILVDLIRYGEFSGFNMDRILYIDSLVMIGSNIVLLSIFMIIMKKVILKRDNEGTALAYFLSGLIFFGISIIRIPLYDIYLNALDKGNYITVFLLNWLVNKNNPVFPYLSFGLFGGWLAVLLKEGDWKKMKRKVLPIALLLLATGITAYVNLPDTMLERSIDPKWFAIMTAQLGLFLMLIIAFLRVYDFRKGKGSRKISIPAKFFSRFGVAGLTAFFLESIVSALVFRMISTDAHSISFDVSGSLAYGFVLALLWGIFLIFWEKKHYRFGIEYFYCRILARFGKSSKEDKLKGMIS